MIAYSKAGSIAAKRSSLRRYRRLGLFGVGLLILFVIVVLSFSGKSGDSEKHTLAINGYVHVYRKQLRLSTQEISFLCSSPKTK